MTSYESFCRLKGHEPWPAQLRLLSEWITARAFGTSDKHMRRLQPDTLQSYLSALRSHHVDRGMSLEVFAHPILDRLIAGARSLFPPAKRTRLPISQRILASITPPPTSVEDLHLNAAFKLAFAAFLRMGEFTYTKQQGMAPAFTKTGLTRSDVVLAVDHATIRLKGVKLTNCTKG